MANGILITGQVIAKNIIIPTIITNASLVVVYNGSERDSNNIQIEAIIFIL